MSRSKDSLKDFLETYKCLPCLWDTTDDMYMDKFAREQAYGILLEKFKVVFGDDATVDFMKKKIDNMRCTYKREYKKVLASRRTGKEEYIPRLWYYDLLTFLNNAGECSSSTQNKSNSSGDEENEEHDQLETTNTIIGEEMRSKKRRLDDVYFDENNDDDGDDDEAFQASQENYSTMQEDNESVSFGKTIGLQLKELSKIQRAIAEKLISEVIFYGRIEKLNMQSTLFLNEEYK